MPSQWFLNHCLKCYELTHKPLMRICWLLTKRVCARKTLLFSPHMQFAILLFRQAAMRKAIGLVILTTKRDIFGRIL